MGTIAGHAPMGDTEKHKAQTERTQKMRNVHKLISKKPLFLRWATLIGSELVPSTRRGKHKIVLDFLSPQFLQKATQPGSIAEDTPKTQFLCSPAPWYQNFYNKDF